MQSSWMFYPKYGEDVVKKVLGCFVNEYLNWADNGYDWYLSKCDSKQEGWMKLEVTPEEYTGEYFSETSFNEDPIPASHLVDNMLILLTEGGKESPAYKPDYWKDTDNKDDYTLYETELCDVIACLCKEDTRIYSPYADKVWSMKVAPYGQRDPKRESILDLLLSQDKLCL